MSEFKPAQEKCDVTRDLMLLCIDGTASEASQRRVDKHVAVCPACATVYQEMRTQIDLDVPVQAETEQFDSAVKQVKKTQARRKLGHVLLGVTLCLMMFAVAAYGYYWYFLEEVPIPLDRYELSLLKRETSRLDAVVIHAQRMPNVAKLHIDIRTDNVQPQWDGDRELRSAMYIWASTTRNVDLDSCEYTTYDYYAFDCIDSEEGRFVVQSEQFWIDSIHQGTRRNSLLLYQVDMDDHQLGHTDGGVLRLRSVYSITHGSAERLDSRSTLSPMRFEDRVTPMPAQ